ncbi:hypothetical protein ACMDCR_31790 [Labrys okinawensis]|uniref:hypothetical protein n=1 Tax=Labrys okinawensis TaxID=346911 RepID=UPI0039BD603B
MKKTAVLPAMTVFGLLALGAGGANADKSPGLSSLQGAWVEQSMNCEQVYRPAKRGMAYRKDVSVFAPAILVSGRRLSTPGASCSIQKVSNKGDRMILDLACTTTITTSHVKAYVSVSDDGAALYRYNDDIEKVGSRYDSCKP